MATPTISSTVNFVKKYPITLCGFSLLFMPSVHRLLLYFTPLLLSTAIFIVAMLSWGPTMSSAADSRGKRRGRSREWAFNGSLKIYGEEEEEEEKEEEEEGAEEVGEGSPKRQTSEGIIQQEDMISITAKANKKLIKPQLQEPDPDFDEKSSCMGMAANGAISGGQAEPDPDYSEDYVGTASSVAKSGCQAEPGPDLSGDCVGAAASNVASSCGQAEPADTDLHGGCVGSACSAEADARGQCLGTASDDVHAAGNAKSCEPDPDLHGEQQIEHPEFTLPDHLPESRDDHCNTEPAPITADQQTACHHHPNYHDAEPDPDLHAALAELREQLDVMKRSPYSDDAHDRHSQKLAERMQSLQAAA